MAKVSLSLSLWPHSGSLIRKHAKATGGRLHGFEIDKAENNRCQCPWSPQALPEKLIGRRGGANGKLRIYSRLPARPTKSSPVQSSPVPVFLYCSVHDHDTMHSRHRSNLLPRYQLSIHPIDENYAPNYPMYTRVRNQRVFPTFSIDPSGYLSIQPFSSVSRSSRFIRENRNLIIRLIERGVKRGCVSIDFRWKKFEVIR